jgi:hypothetical protein
VGKQKGGAQKTKGGTRVSGKNERAARRKQKAVRVRAGKTEGRADSRVRRIGEQPLYANQYLRVPLRFLSWVCV